MTRSDLPETIRAFYDADAAGYFTHRWDRNVVTRADFVCTRDLLLKLLQPKKEARLLEIGCGPGTWTAIVLPLCETVTALDISSGMLAEARKRVDSPRVRFVQADFAGWTPNPWEKFDGAYSVRVFEHLKDKAGALRHLHSTLKPGARAVIVTKTMPSVWNGRVRIMRALRRIAKGKSAGHSSDKSAGFWMERATPRQLAGFFTQAGFVRVGVAPVIFRPPIFRGGESEYPLISDRHAAALLRWHRQLALHAVDWPDAIRVFATIGSESYVAWGDVPEESDR